MFLSRGTCSVHRQHTPSESFTTCCNEQTCRLTSAAHDDHHHHCCVFVTDNSAADVALATFQWPVAQLNTSSPTTQLIAPDQHADLCCVLICTILVEEFTLRCMSASWMPAKQLTERCAARGLSCKLSLLLLACERCKVARLTLHTCIACQVISQHT